MKSVQRHTAICQHWNYLIHTVLPSLPPDVRPEAARRMQSIWDLDAESARATGARFEALDATTQRACEERDMFYDLLSEVFEICRQSEFYIILPQLKKFVERPKTWPAPSEKNRQPQARLEKQLAAHIEPQPGSWSRN